jgi:hypothetical protein
MFWENEQAEIMNTPNRVRMIRQDSELLDATLAHLQAAGIDVTEVLYDGNGAYDALLGLRTAGGTYAYEVQLKNRVSPASAHVNQPPPGRRQLLVAPHISDKVGEALRKQDVHYVDSVGNMYLRGQGLLLDVRGRRGQTARPGAPDQPLRTFKPTGLKVVFALLADPDLVAATYRDVARASGVSLGTVHWVLNELEIAGYAMTAPRRLHRTRNLLDRWVEAYALDLSPRLHLARFDATDPAWWKNADDALRTANAQWGGETAAHQLNPHLLPKRAVIYASEVPKKLAIEYRFRKTEEEGGGEIRQRFWSFPDDPSLTVPTPLIYADLVATADPRLAEAATNLRKSDALLQRLDRG